MRLNLMEIIKSPFNDPDWIKKTLIGTLAQFFVLSGPIVVGYMFNIIRQSAESQEDTLPEYDDVGGLWVSGFVFSLIMCAIFLVPGLVVAAGVFMMLGGAFGSDSGGGAMIGIGAIVVILVGILLCILSILGPALMMRYAMTRRIGSLVDFRTAIADIKLGFGDYMIVLSFPFLAGVVAATISFVTAGLGAILSIPISVLSMYIQARLIGTYYRLYLS